MAATGSKFRTIIDTLKLVSVEPYAFLCLFGYIVRLVTFQSLLMDSACRNLHLYPEDVCSDLSDKKVQRLASIEAGNNLYAGVMLLSSTPAILVAIFLGPWSDKYSRKYPLLFSAGGLFLENAMTAVLCFFPNVSPIWYVAAAIFSGFSGGYIMSVSAAFSYLSDITDERSRPARYAVLEFANISAIVLGNILGGQIFKAGGYKPVMILAPCSFAAAILYTVVFVKETIPKAEGLTTSDMLRDLITVENIKQSYKTCSMKRPGNIRLQLWLLIYVSVCQKFTDMGTLGVAFPFAKEMYNWDVTDFSNASTAFYVVNAIATIAVVPMLANKLRLHEAALGLIGMLSLTAKMTITSVAFTEPFFYYAWMVGVLNNCAGIAIRSRLSKLVAKEELGRIFSLLGTCESVTPLLGTLAFVQIYNASLGVFPGLPFAASAVFLLPCIGIFTWMLRLPTISVGEYDREEKGVASSPMETFSSNYITLKEEEL